ncbi:MAG: phosphonate ABC transporter substrate-binding protein [Alphaproteobacteria bacterium]|nr:phosphonate ABC transporter substrate-binding protein [Alphaproteobacteria bacterium]
MIRRIACLAVAVWLGAVGARAGELKELSFGVIATDSSAAIKQRYEPLFHDLELALGMPVKLFYASDYAGMIQAMRFAKVQIARYGNKSAAEAVDRADAEVAFRAVDHDGAMGYHSVLIVHRDSPLQSVDDVLRDAATLNFGAGDPNSTSGTLVPGYYVFAKHGVDARKIFKRSVVANHEVNALSVATRQVDVATNNDVALARFAKAQPDKFATIRVIWTSPLIPNDPFVWRKDLPEALKAKLETFFAAYGVEGAPDKVAHERAVLAGLQWQRIVRSSNAQLNPTREIELFTERLKIEGDAALAADEKARKLAEIDIRLNALERQAEGS